MKKLFLTLVFCPLILFGQQADVIITKEISRFAFGSCSKQNLPDNQLWKEINAIQPDLWVWLGDNIYGDTEDMDLMKEKYDLQKSHPDYQKLLTQTAVIGIWDDHDFGVNDGGKEFLAKKESKEQLFDFLDVDQKHPARVREGAYQSYTYKSEKGNIKFILLDTRYFRDELLWNNPGTSQKASIINPEGDILGEAQWKWLEAQLSEQNIDLFIVASGIQVIPMQHRWEKWSNFPKSRTRLFELTANVNAPMILLSGDRHLSEVSKINVSGYKHPLYEFTSSSLTNGSGINEEENRYIVEEKIFQTNFAEMTLEWKNEKPVLNVKYRGKSGKILAKHKVQYK